MATEYSQGSWRTPAQLDSERWRWLADQFTLEGQAFNEVMARLERIERQLDELKPRRRGRPPKVDDSVKT